MSLIVYTARISSKDPCRFDVTRQSGGPEGSVFAPSWSILNAARSPQAEHPRIMVDELVSWPTETTSQAALHFGHGKQSCHLTTDGPLDKLHVFASGIGLRFSWFQAPPKASHPHYDLTPNKRNQALCAGAVEVSAHKQALDRRILREAAWEKYVPAYTQEMRNSYSRNRDAWNLLLARDRAVLCCYCVNPARCHRTLLAEILGKLGAEVRGELKEEKQ